MCLWSRWIQLHPCNQEREWVTTIKIALANSSVWCQVTVVMKWLCPLLGSVPLAVWATCRVNVARSYTWCPPTEVAPVPLWDFKSPLVFTMASFWGILQNNFDDMLLLSSFGVKLCIWCSFPVMGRTEGFGQSQLFCSIPFKKKIFYWSIVDLLMLC